MSMRKEIVTGVPAGRQIRKARTLAARLSQLNAGPPSYISRAATFHGPVFFGDEPAGRERSRSDGGGQPGPKSIGNFSQRKQTQVTKSDNPGEASDVSKRGGPKRAMSSGGDLRNGAGAVKFSSISFADGAATPSTACPSPGSENRSFSGTPMTNNTPRTTPLNGHRVVSTMGSLLSGGAANSRAGGSRTLSLGDLNIEDDVGVLDTRNVDLGGRKRRTKSLGLGAHYDKVPEDLQEREEWLDREEHDRMLCQTISKRRPDEVPHPLLSKPRQPMTTAFTDRSARMRDGVGSKIALEPNRDQSTEWAVHGKCTCDVCRPERCRPAGQVSHAMPHHKVARCLREVFPLPPQTTPALDSRNLNGLAHGVLTETDHMEAESKFRNSLGHKVRTAKERRIGASGTSMTHRGEVGLGASAGQYDQDYAPEIGSYGNRRSRSCEPRIRSGMTLVLDPQPCDPPPPTRVCLSRKKTATQEPSAESAASAVYHNQEILRFAEPGVVRGRNTPAMDDASRAGLPTEGFDTRAQRQNPTSDFCAKGRPIGSRSRSMGDLLDHAGTQRSFDEVRAHRLTHEKAFSDMCNQTANHGVTQRFLNTTVKNACGSNVSDGVKTHLAWPEYE